MMMGYYPVMNPILTNLIIYGIRLHPSRVTVPGEMSTPPLHGSPVSAPSPKPETVALIKEQRKTCCSSCFISLLQDSMTVICMMYDRVTPSHVTIGDLWIIHASTLSVTCHPCGCWSSVQSVKIQPVMDKNQRAFPPSLIISWSLSYVFRYHNYIRQCGGES